MTADSEAARRLEAPEGSSAEGPPSTPDAPAQPQGEGGTAPAPAQVARILRWSGVRMRAVATTGLFILALLYSLYFAAEFLIPLATAAFLGLVLLPIVRVAERFHIPSFVTAGAVVLWLVATIGAGFVGLAAPAADWIDRSPRVLGQLEDKLREVKEPIEALRRAADEVQKSANVGGQQSAEVAVAEKNLLERAFGGVIHTLTQFAVIVVLLVFLLSSGDLFKEKLVRVMPTLTEKKRAVTIWREIEHDVSRYLFTVSVINAGLGAVVGFGLYLVGMPNPMLWGVMVAFLNYIPYFGPLVGAAILGLVGVIAFDKVELALIPPAILIVANAIEGTFVTPAILGRRFEINAVVIFVAVAFWGWIWGIPGALLAVPILVAFKVVCDHVEHLKNVGEFLGR
jgi:predicted PurR-regulated permease PerM